MSVWAFVLRRSIAAGEGAAWATATARAWSPPERERPDRQSRKRDTCVKHRAGEQ